MNENRLNQRRVSAFLILYLFMVLGSHLFIGFRSDLPININLFSAIIGGCFSSLLWPLLIIYLCSHVKNTKAFIAVIELFLLFLCLLTIIDLFYFNVTLARFNWSVAHDLNYYAIKASTIELVSNKFQLVPFILAFFSAVLARFAVSFWRTPEIPKTSYNLLIICIILKFFFPYEEIKTASNFTPVVMKARGQNLALSMINQGHLKGFFTRTGGQKTTLKEFTPYSSEEKAMLLKSGLIAHSSPEFTGKPFKKIILLVFESLALEYLNRHNSLIPVSASDFFDKLDASYPSSQAFFTSASPTLNGLYAMLNSRIPFNRNLAEKRREKSLAQLFKEKHGGQAYFIRGVSKFYGGENLILNNLLGFDHLVTYEELAKKYPEPGLTAWGYHDDIVLKAATEVLLKEKNRPLFMLIKLMDMHQPPYYCGLPAQDLPTEIAHHPSPIVKSIYWANHLLKQFYEDLEKHSLFDDETLMVITSDHYPPLGYGHLDLVQDSKGNYLGRIPLIFVTTRSEALIEISTDKTTCQIDLAPSLCFLAGLKPSPHFIGQNIFSPEAISRRVGLFNDNLTIFSPEINVTTAINSPSTPNQPIKKWIANLNAGKLLID